MQTKLSMIRTFDYPHLHERTRETINRIIGIFKPRNISVCVKCGEHDDTSILSSLTGLNVSGAYTTDLCFSLVLFPMTTFLKISTIV